MVFWLIVALAALASAAWIAAPFLRSSTVEMSTADGAISIYRDQIEEIERDRAAGLIGEAEQDAARGEIERRALKAARTMDQGFTVSHRSWLAAGVLGAAAFALALGLYSQLGTPDARDRPLALRQEERLVRLADAGDIDSRIQLLIRSVGENPESFEDWWMLARSYSSIGDHASAADAYRNAAMLADDRPGVLSAYAEAMTLANGNKVPSAARLIFDQLARESGDPRARYYVALARAQDQDFEGAALAWAALARDSRPEAPWMPLVRRDITNMAKFLNREVAEFLPDATPAELVASGRGLLPSSAEVGQSALKAAVAKDPKDWKSWLALADQLSLSGDQLGAIEAIASARSEFLGAPFVLQKITETEERLGLDLAAPVRGPSGEDIAIAAKMSEDERADMIEGMVSGLAARLEEQPDDVGGWIMLIRSYVTMGKGGEAREALATANAFFSEDAAVLAQIAAQVGGLVEN